MIAGFVVIGIPMIFLIPINGLVIFGYFLNKIGFSGSALLMWFSISILIILISILKGIITRRRINIFNIKFLFRIFLPWFIFVIYLYLSYFLLSASGSNYDYAINKIILVTLKGIFPALFISIWILYCKNNRLIEKINMAFIWFGLSQSFFIVQSLLDGPINYRMTVLGLNPIWVARELGVGIVAALLFFEKRWFKYPIIITLGWGIYLTRSRGPFLSLLIVAILIYSFNLIKSRKYRQLAPIIIILMIFSVFVLFGFNMDDYFLRGESSFLESNNIRARLQLYFAAWDDFTSSPVLGKGVGSFYYNGHTYPHNIIIELLAETGIVGLVIFIFALKPKNLIRFNNAFTFFFIFSLITTMFSGDLEKNAYLIMFSILANLDYNISKNKMKLESYK
jgi:O-antigen ligase